MGVSDCLPPTGKPVSTFVCLEGRLSPVTAPIFRSIPPLQPREVYGLVRRSFSIGGLSLSRLVNTVSTSTLGDYEATCGFTFVADCSFANIPKEHIVRVLHTRGLLLSRYP